MIYILPCQLHFSVEKTPPISLISSIISKEKGDSIRILSIKYFAKKGRISTKTNTLGSYNLLDMIKTLQVVYPYYLLSFGSTVLLGLTTSLWWWLPPFFSVLLTLLYFWTFRKQELYFFKNKRWDPALLLLALVSSTLLLSLILSTLKTM